MSGDGEGAMKAEGNLLRLLHYYLVYEGDIMCAGF